MTIRHILLAGGIAAAALAACYPDSYAGATVPATHQGTAQGCPDGRGTFTLGGLTPDYSHGATVVEGSGAQVGILAGDNADHTFNYSEVPIGGTLTVYVTSIASPQHRAGDYIHTFTFIVGRANACTHTTSPPPPTTSPATTATTTQATTTTSAGGSTTTSSPGSPTDTTTVAQPPSTLPKTGSDLARRVARGAATALGLGLVLLLAARRRTA